MLLSVGQQNHTTRGLFVIIHSLSLSAPRTVVKSPSDQSSAVPPAAVTLLTSFVCTVPGFTRAKSSRRNEQAAVKADAHCLIHLPGTRYQVSNHTSRQSWHLFCVPIVAFNTRNDGALSLFQETFLDSSSHVCSSLLPSVLSSLPVVSKFPDGVRARAKFPDGSTVTGIRHHNFVL